MDLTTFESIEPSRIGEGWRLLADLVGGVVGIAVGFGLLLLISG